MINACQKIGCHCHFIKMNIRAGVEVSISSVFSITPEGLVFFFPLGPAIQPHSLSPHVPSIALIPVFQDASHPLLPG